MDSDSSPVVFEISSDEEPPWVGGPTRDSRDDDHDWLTEILNAFDKHNDDFVGDEKEDDADDDDDDEVVVVGEVKAKPRGKITQKGLNSDNEVDDDCIVLDGDPDKRKDAVKEKKDGDGDGNGDGDGDGDGDDDELVIVGEKGQVEFLFGSEIIKLISVT